jgi:hypothetical protein
MSAKEIIKLSRTSDDQILLLAKKLNVQVDQIDFKNKMNKVRLLYSEHGKFNDWWYSLVSRIQQR